MTEQMTINVGLIVPSTGDLPGAWGTAALNANSLALDGLIGGVQAFSLSGATSILLTAPSGSITPGAGPTQSQNKLLRFTGSMTGTAFVNIPLPGLYVIDNQTTGTTYPLVIGAATTLGDSIGIPQGEKTHIFCDGTNCDYVGLARTGSYLDLAVATTPVWIRACTVAPYLVCDGTQNYSVATFPALAAMLGSTFGGNGNTTFGVPDHQNRINIPLDFGGNNRVTNAGSGINGTQFGASGGSQNLQSHNHGASGTDSGHLHTIPASGVAISATSGGQTFLQSGAGLNTGVGFANISVSVATSGVGSSGNIPPGIVGGIRLIKT
jgi:microcystin-dependent protein